MSKSSLLKIAGIGIGAVCVASIGFFALHKATAADHLKRGQELAMNGVPRDGIPEYEEAVRLEPDNPDALSALAAALESYNFRRVTMPEKRLVLLSAYAAPRWAVGRAVLLTRKALVSNPNQALWHQSLGNELEQIGSYSEAIKEQKTALRLILAQHRSDDVYFTGENFGADKKQLLYNSYISLGEAFLREGHPQEASHAHAQALKYVSG